MCAKSHNCNKNESGGYDAHAQISAAQIILLFFGFEKNISNNVLCFLLTFLANMLILVYFVICFILYAEYYCATTLLSWRSKHGDRDKKNS
jgi:hypothetical protein